jgi:hypothetical protein
LIHKFKTEEPKTEQQQLQTGLTGEEHQSDRCVTTQSGDFEVEDTRRDRKACVKVKQVAVAGHPSDGLLMVKFCQPSHKFTFGVGMSFISYPLVLTLLV